LDTERVNIKVKLEEKSSIPKYMTSGAAGLDVAAYIEEDIILKPMERVLIPTGIKMEIPFGYEVEVRPRSGLAIKYGITVLNSPGTIDSDYRGEVKIILINFGNEDYTIKNGDRIAQLVLKKIIVADVEITSELSETKRDKFGFGHTGEK